MKVISGGQTGVDRAALDAAMSAGMPVGGWCPAGRRAEDGPIHSRYPLSETPAPEYAQRTEWNVRDSDATLILSRSSHLSGGTLFTEECTRLLKRPVLIVDPRGDGSLDHVVAWIRDEQVEVLNVAGPRDSEDHEIYQNAVAFLGRVFAQVRHSVGAASKS